MEKLCADCAGDFRRFTGDILRTHLQTQPADWLATLIQAIGGVVLWLGAQELFPHPVMQMEFAHLPGCSRFHSAVFHGHHGIRWNLQPLDRGFGSRMVGTRNRLVVSCSFRMAAHQRTGGSSAHFR